MKVAAVAEQIERSGVQKEKEFGIIFDAKMVRILSDQLYQDKVGSIIRELSCNAYDSHIEAGKRDVPFVVHLPNRLEPFFYVQDHGVGLGPEQVRKIYTVYGSSTKTTSNEQIGQLGLGSKSPFSYVDAFDVIAVKNGKMNSYTMYKDERGMTCCAELGEPVDTDEPNGVMVRFPVKADDIYEFNRKAQEVFKWFPIKPTVIGASFTTPKITYHWSNDHWGIIDSNKTDGYSTYNCRSVALMGNVAYPLTPDTFKNELSASQREILNRANLVLKFDIGELEVTASREGLGYDNRTIAAIKKKFDILIRDLSEMFEKEMVSCTSLWEAKAKFGAMFVGERAIFQRIFATDGLKWTTHRIKDNEVLIDQEVIYGKKIIKSIGVDKKPEIDPTVYWDFQILERANPHYSRKSKPKKIDYQTFGGSAHSNTVVIFNDLPHGGMSRIQHARENDNTYYIFGASKLKTWEQIAKLLGDPKYIIASSLDKPPKKVPVKRPERVLVWSPNNTSSTSGWADITIDVNAGGVYVNLERWDIKLFGSIYSRSSFGSFLDKMINANLLSSTTQIYAGRNNTRKTMATQSNWIELTDYLTSKFNTLNLAEITEKLKLLHLVNHGDLVEVVSLASVEWNGIDDTSDFKQICSKVHNMTDDVIKNKKYLFAVNEVLGYFSTDTKISLHKSTNIEIKNLCNRIQSQYPLVSELTNRTYTNSLTTKSIQNITQYVKLVDENMMYRRMVQNHMALTD